jgi:hypothetical protein
MPAGRTSPRVSRAAAVLAIAAGLAITGCGQAPPDPVSGAASSAPAPASPGASSPASVSSDQPVAPLTGLPVASAADAARPAVALAVGGAHPQGLSSADVVFEEISSPVRYIAVYQSSEAGTVSPIAATDTTDRRVLAVLHPLLGYDGAVPYVVTMLGKTKIIDAGYSRYPSLYTSRGSSVTTTPETISHGVAGGTAPPPIFAYRAAGPAGGTLATTGVVTRTSVSVRIPGLGTQDWTFDQHANRWAMTSGGPGGQAANLVIQTVPYKSVRANAKLGTASQEAQVIGSGRAEVFSGGRGGGTGASGTWSKPHSGLVTNYFDSSGSLMAFDPGPTWVILAPPGTRVSTSGQ